MATGWAGDGAVQDQIDATIKDAIQRVRSQLPQGPGAGAMRGMRRGRFRRRDARPCPGVRLCVPCQEARDPEQDGSPAYNRRGSKDSQLR